MRSVIFVLLVSSVIPVLAAPLRLFENGERTVSPSPVPKDDSSFVARMYRSDRNSVPDPITVNSVSNAVNTLFKTGPSNLSIRVNDESLRLLIRASQEPTVDGKLKEQSLAALQFWEDLIKEASKMPDNGVLATNILKNYQPLKSDYRTNLNPLASYQKFIIPTYSKDGKSRLEEINQNLGSLEAQQVTNPSQEPPTSDNRTPKIRVCDSKPLPDESDEEPLPAPQEPARYMSFESVLRQGRGGDKPRKWAAFCSFAGGDS